MSYYFRVSHVITIANRKGGVGKSTITLNLAVALLRGNRSVFIVDADPQGTLSRWARVRTRQLSDNSIGITPNITVTQTPWSSEEILKLDNPQPHDFILIDCGPANNKVVKAALSVSSIALIPISPSPLDIDSARSTIDLIQEGIERRAVKVKPFLVISKKITGTNLASEARQAIQALNLPVLKSEISQRIAFCESTITGQSVLEYAPDSLAAQEVISLAKEVKQCLRQN